MKTLTKGTTDLITVNRIGNGLKFDGVNDAVAVPYNTVFDFEKTDSFSFSTFVSFSNLTIHRILTKLRAASDPPHVPGYGILIYNNIVVFFLFTPTPYSERRFESPVYPFVTGQIYYITISYNNNTCRIYVNGVELSTTPSGTFPSGSIKGNAELILGNYLTTRTSEPLAGNLYDLKVFNTNISAGQVTQLYTSYNQDLTGLTANLVADYNFNQKSGTILTDNSPNQLHGTLTNFGATSNLGGGAWVNSLGNTITY